MKTLKCIGNFKISPLYNIRIKCPICNKKIIGEFCYVDSVVKWYYNKHKCKSGKTLEVLIDEDSEYGNNFEDDFHTIDVMYRYKGEAKFIDLNLSKRELDRYLKLDLLTEDAVMNYEEEHGIDHWIT